MKQLKLMTLLLIVCVLALVSVAQARPHSPEAHVEKLNSKLTLTEDQSTNILAIFEDAFASCEDEETRQEHKACMKDQKSAVQEAVKLELTAEQVEVLESGSSDDGRKACREFRRSRR